MKTKKPNPKNFHTVLRRQGAYTMTTFTDLDSAQEFVWTLLKQDKRFKFAILRNRDNIITHTFNNPRWKELKAYAKHASGIVGGKIQVL